MNKKTNTPHGQTVRMGKHAAWWTSTPHGQTVRTGKHATWWTDTPHGLGAAWTGRRMAQGLIPWALSSGGLFGVKKVKLFERSEFLTFSRKAHRSSPMGCSLDFSLLLSLYQDKESKEKEKKRKGCNQSDYPDKLQP